MTYSQDFVQINPCKSKVCRACGLYMNQYPIFDVRKISNVFWVGLSAVQFQDSEVKLPLSPSTRTGALVHSIEGPFSNYLSFYKTNLVKCVPMKESKIRYPVEHEMEKCFPNFEMEITDLNPSLVFLLGKQVSTFVLKKLGYGSNFQLDDNFRYESFEANNIQFVPIHHPSYVLVYKRKLIDSYVYNIRDFFSDVVMPNCKSA